MRAGERSLRPHWLVPWLLLVLALVLVGSVGAYQAAHMPGVSEQLPPNAAPLVVTVGRPANGSAYPADAFVPVAAKAVAARPVIALELWADGALVRRKEAPARLGQKLLAAFWSWQPASEGEHTLLVRAVDLAGAIGQSRPVRVRATAAVDARLLVTAKDGDTVESLARGFGTSPEGILGLNPRLDGAGPLSAGQGIFAPLLLKPLPGPQAAALAAAAPQPRLARPVSDGPPSKVALWLRKRVLSPARPPLAPVLTLATEGCSAHLFVADKSGDEAGFFVYRLAPNAAGFARIATLGPNGGSLPLQYTDRGLSGHVEYYVSSFNAAGESPSNLYGVDLNGPGCLGPYWGGLKPPTEGLRLVDGKLIASGRLEKVYCYTSVDQGPWQRVPADPDSFILRMSPANALHWAEGVGLLDEVGRGDKGVFHLRQTSWTRAQHSVSFEVWGWSGGSLLRLGEYSATVGTSRLAKPSLWLWSDTGLSICGNTDSCREGLGWTREVLVAWDEEDQARELSWSTGAPGATGAVWQLALTPFGQGFDPSPPGLVASGAVSGQGGSFKIDLADLAQPPLEDAAGSATSAVPRRSGSVAAALPGAAQPLSLVFGGPEVGAQTALPAIGFPHTYYARLTPMAGNQQAGLPSETIVIHYGPPQGGSSPVIPPPPGIYAVRIAEFRPIVFPKSELWGCVRITRNDRYTGKPDATNPDPWSIIPVGTVVCPEVYKGEGEKLWYEQPWGLAAGAVDWAAKAYESHKNAVVDMVALTVPFCDSSCKARLGTGLNVPLAAAGVPPGLLSYDALTDTGQARLAELLTEQAGADCAAGSLCREAIKEGVGALREAARAGGSNTACLGEEEARSHGREPLCLPAGTVGEPIEGAEYVPAALLVQVTRSPQSEDLPEADCGRYVLHVRATARNDSLVGKPILVPVNTYMVDGAHVDATTEGQMLSSDEPLEGELFGAVELEMLRLRPGETVIIPVELRPTSYWIPGHQEMIKKAAGHVRYDDWLKLYFDGEARLRVSVDCYTTLGWVNCGYQQQGWDEVPVNLPSASWS